jgi:hypothetical protein
MPNRDCSARNAENFPPPQVRPSQSTALYLDGSGLRKGQRLNPKVMSALGQKRTLRRLHPMSALPPKADIDR